MKAIVPRGSSLEIKFSLSKPLKSNMYNILHPCLNSTFPLVKTLKGKEIVKRKMSCKNTLEINKREKNRDKKKSLGLPPKQRFF